MGTQPKEKSRPLFPFRAVARIPYDLNARRLALDAGSGRYAMNGSLFWAVRATLSAMARAAGMLRSGRFRPAHGCALCRAGACARRFRRGKEPVGF